MAKDETLPGPELLYPRARPAVAVNVQCRIDLVEMAEMLNVPQMQAMMSGIGQVFAAIKTQQD